MGDVGTAGVLGGCWGSAGRAGGPRGTPCPGRCHPGVPTRSTPWPGGCHPEGPTHDTPGCHHPQVPAHGTLVVGQSPSQGPCRFLGLSSSREAIICMRHPHPDVRHPQVLARGTPGCHHTAVPAHGIPCLGSCHPGVPTLGTPGYHHPKAPARATLGRPSPRGPRGAVG